VIGTPLTYDIQLEGFEPRPGTGLLQSTQKKIRIRDIENPEHENRNVWNAKIFAFFINTNGHSLSYSIYSPAAAEENDTGTQGRSSGSHRCDYEKFYFLRYNAV
jgi:hypothetical protein